MQEVRFQPLSKSKLSLARNGSPLSEASELLAPETWETYQENHPTICILGNAESEKRYSLGAAALRALVQLTLQLALEEKLALKVLDPPGSPTARWVSLSGDVLRTLEPENFYVDQSKIKLPDGPKLEVRVFRPDEPDPAAEMPFDGNQLDGSHELPKWPAKVRVPKAWEDLPKETKRLVSTHGGKKKIALILKKMLPDLRLGTIERELRRLWVESPP